MPALPAYPADTDNCQVPGSCGAPALVSDNVLFFEAQNVPPVGHATYFVRTAMATAGAGAVTRLVDVVVGPRAMSGDTVVSNGAVTLTFAAATGLLSTMSAVGVGALVGVAQEVVEYTTETVGPFGGGAYLFKPQGPAAPLVAGPVALLQVADGPLVTEVRQTFTAPCPVDAALHGTCGVAQVFRLYKSADVYLTSSVETLFFAGPLQPQRDLSVRYNTSLHTGAEFFSDDNCFESQLRTVKNQSVIGSPIAGQFYPGTCQAFMRDASLDAQFVLLFDRTHAVSGCLADGSLEALMHRRVLSTDAKGPLDLNDRDVLQRIATTLLLANTSFASVARHVLQHRLQYPLTVALGPLQVMQSWPFTLSSTALAAPLPANVHLLTLQAMTFGAPVLVRLAHIFEKVDGGALSGPALAPVVALLRPGLLVPGVTAREVALNAVQNISVLPDQNFGRLPLTPDGAALLAPTDIRTFYLR